MLNQEIIQHISSALHSVFPKGRYILYGSRARGDFKNSSDVDILIIMPDSLDGQTNFELQSTITNKLYNLELQWDMAVDISPVFIKENEFEKFITPFTINIKREGIEL